MANHVEEVLLRLIQKLETRVETLEKRVKDLEQAPRPASTYPPMEAWPGAFG